MEQEKELNAQATEPVRDPDQEFREFLKRRQKPLPVSWKLTCIFRRDITLIVLSGILAFWGWPLVEHLVPARLASHPWLHLIAFACLQAVFMHIAMLWELIPPPKRETGEDRETVLMIIAALFWLFALIPAAAMMSILATVFFGLMWWSPDWWWVGATAYGLLFGHGWAKLLLPKRRQTRPLDQSEQWVEERARTLTDGTGVGFSSISVLKSDGHDFDNNMLITGRGDRKALLIGEPLLRWLSPPQVGSIIAHELGHIALRHMLIRRVISAFTFAGTFYLISIMLPPLSGYAGLSSSQEVAAFSLLYFLLQSIAFLRTQLTNLVSRITERQADWWGFERNRDPEGFKEAMLRFALLRNESVEAPSWQVFLRSHPTHAQRLAEADRWRREHPLDSGS